MPHVYFYRLTYNLYCNTTVANIDTIAGGIEGGEAKSGQDVAKLYLLFLSP